jgi:arylsulfatase A-like enzyme
MYQMNHRVVANGTPLDDRFDNVARLANRAGLHSVLFGYTDQSIDPRVTTGPDDPRLLTYEGLLPGFDWRLDLTGDMTPWVEHLAALGHDTSGGNIALLASEHERPAEHGISAFTTDRIIEWLGSRDDDRPFFLHASYLRPHPPYSAPGHFADLYDPADVGLPLAPVSDRHPAHDLFLSIGWVTAPTDEAAIRRLRAQYYGMITAVDHEVGRLVTALRNLGLYDSTSIIVTADHGEQLGDHGLVQKVGSGSTRDVRAVDGSMPSPRASTSCPRWPRPGVSRCRCSATVCRSPRSSMARHLRGGGRSRHGSSTGGSR